MFDAVVHRPAYLQVADQLREAILSGQLRIGDPVPAERELCERFGVSRPTVREALRALQAQALVVSVGPTAPLRVAGPEAVSAGPLRDALTHVLRLGSVSLRDLVELRCALETAAVRAMAARSEPPDLSAVYDAFDESRAAGDDLVAFERADVRLHVELVAASGNEALQHVMAAMRTSMESHLLDALRALEDPRPILNRLINEHEHILLAIKGRKPVLAEELAREHIEGFYVWSQSTHEQ
ncbi:FadR/GntR family transcriptional regulator [Rhodococcus rhodochrous]|uniref:FadR/GntR family transcriptional regulator n=1 Tax=Rhodococcus rhodochrous TaxID=1829 RepID=UPI0006C8819D|nr:FadR/GntR family transcriptional regulator [Rhodococcus rhodochrous]